MTFEPLLTRPAYGYLGRTRSNIFCGSYMVQRLDTPRPWKSTMDIYFHLPSILSFSASRNCSLLQKKKIFFSLYICQKSGMTEGDTYLLAYSPNGHNNPFGIRQNTGNKKLHPTLLCKRQRPKCLGHLFAAS